MNCRIVSSVFLFCSLNNSIGSVICICRCTASLSYIIEYLRNDNVTIPTLSLRVIEVRVKSNEFFPYSFLRF